MRWLKALFTPARLWAIAAGVTLLAFGISLLTEYEMSNDLLRHKLPGLFATELGFAFLIAVIIFAVLEEEATREHSKTVLGYLYGVDPKGKFFLKLQDYILKQRHYRNKTVVSYRFLEKSGESIFIRYTVEYTVTNQSREHKPDFLLKGSLNKKPLNTGVTPWDDRLGVERVEVNDEEIAIESLTITQGSSEHCQCYEAEPIPLAPKDSARVKVVHYMVKHDHDSEVWHGSIPCMGVELRLEWSEGLGLVFATEAIHPEPGAMKENRSANKLKVTLNEPFMVHHGIHFSWTSAAASKALTAQTTILDAQPGRGRGARAGPGHD